MSTFPFISTLCCKFSEIEELADFDGEIGLSVTLDEAGQPYIEAYQVLDSSNSLSYAKSYLTACDLFSIPVDPDIKKSPHFANLFFRSHSSNYSSSGYPPSDHFHSYYHPNLSSTDPKSSTPKQKHVCLPPRPAHIPPKSKSPNVSSFLARKKYKPVAKKVRPVHAQLPEGFRIVRDIKGDPLETLPTLNPKPPPFEPTGRYTEERREQFDRDNDTGFLTPAERDLLHHFMTLHQDGFAWNDAERGHFREDFFPPVEIPVVPHKPWVLRNIPIPPGIHKQVCDLIQKKLDAGVFEPSNSSYRSRWFCVVKKDGKTLRIVQSLEPLNAVTIAHSGVPPFTEQLAEQFAALACAGMLDLYIGYDERAIAVASRDLTTFQTPFGALRLTTLPMGWTNSVPIFHDDVTYILRPEIPDVTIPYIDDIPVKGPKSRYILPNGDFETIPENPGIRRFVWEHFQGLNRVVQRMKYSGGTFSGFKSLLCAPEITVLGHRCTYEGRLPDLKRVAVIVNWGPCTSLSDVRSFLGTIGVCRLFIRNFAHRAHHLTKLTKKDFPFEFGPEQIAAQEDLKKALLASPALRPLNYESEAPVILSVDTSYIAIGHILSQCDVSNPKVRYHARFGSITLNEREARFSQPKLELYGLYRSFRSLKLYLIGLRNLIVEVDAKYIKGMLSNPDIAPAASINRWIVAILTFHFTLVHVPGAFHGPDGLSRRIPQPGDEPEPEDDFDDWIDNLHGFMHMINPTSPAVITQPPALIYIYETITPTFIRTSIRPLKTSTRPLRSSNTTSEILLNTSNNSSNTTSITSNTSNTTSTTSTQASNSTSNDSSLPSTSTIASTPLKEPNNPSTSSSTAPASSLDTSNLPYSAIPRSEQALKADTRLSNVQNWHNTLERPTDMSDSEYNTFVRYCTEFFVKFDRLWRKDPQGKHKIVIPQDRRLFIIASGHDDVGHHGFYATSALISERFWWPFMGFDIGWYVRTCHICQLRRTQNVLIPPTVAMPAPIFSKVYLDTMHLPVSGGFKYITQARCSLIHYPEYAVLRRETNRTVGEFIFKDLICRYGLLLEIVTDNGPPIIKACEYLTKKYGIKHIRISGYNSRANGIIERSHFDIRQALFKASDGDESKWHQVVSYMFWADRVTVRRRMGCSPYFGLTGTHPLLPFDIAEANYLLPPPDQVLSTTDLIARRSIALQKRREDLEQLRSKVYEARVKAAIRFEQDNVNTIKTYDFKLGDLVLIRNTAIEKSLNRKMRPRYLGPLIVISRNRGGSYILSELNGSLFDRPIAAFRVIPYFARTSIPLPPLNELLDVSAERLRQLEESNSIDPEEDNEEEIEEPEPDDD